MWGVRIKTDHNECITTFIAASCTELSKRLCLTCSHNIKEPQMTVMPRAPKPQSYHCLNLRNIFFKWHSKMPTSSNPRQNLSKTRFMLPPFSMEITLVWSSSLIQTRNVLSLLCLVGSKQGIGITVTQAFNNHSHRRLIVSFHLSPFLSVSVVGSIERCAVLLLWQG